MTDPVHLPPATPPVWATAPGSTVEPTIGQRQAGWQVDQQPPARWQNDWQRKVYQGADMAAAALRKDFREVELDIAIVNFPIDQDECPLCFHKGAWYMHSKTGHERVFKSTDLKGWVVLSEPPGTPVIGAVSLSIASDGSRMVFTYAGAGGNSFYSDDDGDNATGNLVGMGPDPRAFYMPIAGVWLALSSDGSATYISSDGITFAATDFSGQLADNGYGVAERTDGTLLVMGGAGGIYSVNGGTNWFNVTNGVAESIDGYYYSSLMGEIVGFGAGGSRGLRKMSTAGTWDGSDFGNLPAGFSVDGMFEINNAMYAYGEWENPATPSNVGTQALAMSLDLGVTWEIVAQFTSSIEGSNGLQHLNFVQPVVGHRPGANTGFIGTVAEISSTRMESIISPYTGQTFAAALAP